MTDGLIGEIVGGRSPLAAYFSMEIALDPAMPTRCMTSWNGKSCRATTKIAKASSVSCGMRLR